MRRRGVKMEKKNGRCRSNRSKWRRRRRRKMR
jgi:hypothetical protein